jgi:hypothetical protein
MNSNINCTIIYLKDKPDGTVEVSLELIGNPDRSFKIGKVVAENMQELNYTVFNMNNEFTMMPPTDRLQ